MALINPYLTFSGNCRQAMIFYKKCLGGQLYLQTVGQNPLLHKMPKRIKNCILLATLTNDGMVLQGSDLVGQTGLTVGNRVSLSTHCSSQTELKKIYNKLVAGGIAQQPIMPNNWGAMFGSLTDKFGIHWLLSC